MPDLRERHGETGRFLAVLALALVVIVSGFAVTLVTSWGPLYRANLFFHPLAGIAASVPVLLFSWKRLRSSPAPQSARLGFGLAALGAVLFAMPRVASPDPARFFSFLGLLVLLQVPVFAFLRRRTSNERLASAVVGTAASALWTLNLFAGLSILTLHRDGGIKFVFLTHRLLAVLFTLLVAGTVMVPLALRTFGGQSVAPSHVGGKRAVGLLALGAAALVLVALPSWLHRDPSFRIHLSTIPLADRLPEERAIFFSDPSFPSAALDLVVPCTNGRGCHGVLEKGFLDSNHNISMRTPHFQKNMELLTQEIGADNALICAGCHFPGALFDRSRDHRYYKDKDNLSCSFCHMIGEVFLYPKDNRRSFYDLVPPVDHLRLFVEDGLPARPDRWTAEAIRLSPLTHGRAFSKPLYREDAFCVVCHHHQILLSPEEGLRRPRCIDCHMQPQDQLGMEGPRRNHFMPGANLTVPHFAGREDAVRRIDDWLAGKYPLSLPGWENMWEPRRVRGQDPSRATWLYMVFDCLDEALPGRPLRLRIVTTNAGMEHPFPAAPLDLIEAWLDLRVTDADGRLIYEDGVDVRREPAGSTHTLGGYMIGQDDKLVTMNRVWQIKRKVVTRVLEPGRQTTDEFTFDVPEGAKGPLTIAAHWNYRKLGLDFARWAYGDDVRPPVIQVGALEGRIPLGAPVPSESGR